MCAKNALSDSPDIFANTHSRHCSFRDDSSRHNRAEVCALASRQQLSSTGEQVANARQQAVFDGVKIEAIGKALSKSLAHRCTLIYGIGHINAQQHHQPSTDARANAAANISGNIGDHRLAGVLPPFAERFSNDFIPRQLYTPAKVGILPLIGRGQVTHLCLHDIVFAVNEVHKVAQGSFDIRHGGGQAVCYIPDVVIQAAAKADFYAIHSRLQQRDGARQVVELGVGHALGRASSIVDGVGQLVVVGLGGIQNGQQSLLRVCAGNGIRNACFLLIIHIGGSIA